jgi:hypothetical protein
MHLPMLDQHRAHLRAVRRGEVTLDDVLADIADYERRLTDLKTSARVPDQPDRAWVDAWLIRSHQTYWRAQPP